MADTANQNNRKKLHLMYTELPKSIGLKEFWEELGYTKSTFYRRLSKIGLKPEHRILSPEQQDEYRVRLGFPPKFSPPPPLVIHRKNTIKELFGTL